MKQRDWITILWMHLATLEVLWLFYDWSCDSMYPITDGYELPNHGRQSIYPNGSLVIENAHKLHDEGFYTCTAFNSNDETHSGTLQIEVLSKWHPKLCCSSQTWRRRKKNEGLFFYFFVLYQILSKSFWWAHTSASFTKERPIAQ